MGGQRCCSTRRSSTRRAEPGSLFAVGRRSCFAPGDGPRSARLKAYLLGLQLCFLAAWAAVLVVGVAEHKMWCMRSTLLGVVVEFVEDDDTMNARRFRLALDPGEKRGRQTERPEAFRAGLAILLGGDVCARRPL